MNDNCAEETEIYTIEGKSYKVITRVSKDKLSKENLIKLIVRYAMKDLKIDDI